MKPPILVQLELLVDEDDQLSDEVLGRLAELNQADVPLVLLTTRPDAWRPTRSGMDAALVRQGRIEQAINRAGGAMDAVLYLDFGLFSRHRGRLADLENLAARYDCAPDDLILIAAEGRLSEATQASGGRWLKVDDSRSLADHLAAHLDHVGAASTPR